MTLVSELGDDCVDGFVVTRSWSNIQPTVDGGYDFSSLDADLATVANAGKKAVVELYPGAYGTPSWFCDQPNDCISLVQAQFPGSASTACGLVQLPIPWTPDFLGQFGQAARAFAAHVANNSTVVGIHVTGINDGDSEVALPFTHGGPANCSDGGACQMDAGVSNDCPVTDAGCGWCQQSDGVALLYDAGYSYANAETAYLAFANDFHAGANAVTLGSQVSTSLPDPDAGDLAQALVDELLAADFPSTTCQFNGLMATQGTDVPGINDAKAAAVPIGFQEANPVSATAPAA